MLTLHGKSKYMANILPAIVLVHARGLWTPRPVLERWFSILKTRYIIFKSLSKPLRRQFYEHYTQMFEMASSCAASRETKRYWVKYNLRYLQFTFTARHYGKLLLIGKRVVNKIWER